MSSTMQLVVFNLVLALVIIAIIQVSVRAYLSRHPNRADRKKDRTKLFVFNLVLALVIIALIQISVHVFFHRNPPANVQTLMETLNIPAAVSIDVGMREAVQESFISEFSALYGIDPEPDETAYFSTLLQGCTAEFDMEPFLRETLAQECRTRRITEESMIRQIMGIPDPAEQDKIRAEWIASGQALVLRSEDFIRTMEPVYRKFYEWWTPRHPEYEGIASGITLTDDHEALVGQIAVSLRRELVVRMAQELSECFETDLRKLGKVISEAKLHQAFALFIRLGKERYPEKMIWKMAEATVKETELTDEEILHCLILRDRKLSEDRLSTIRDVQMRYLTAGTQDQIHTETASEIQKELQKIAGLETEQ